MKFTIEIDTETEMEVIRIAEEDLRRLMREKMHGRLLKISLGCIQLDISFANETEFVNLNSLYESGKLKDILLEAFNTQAVRDVIGVEEVDIVVERPILEFDEPPPGTIIIPY